MPRARNPLAVHVRAIRRALTMIDRSLGQLVAISKAERRGIPAGWVPRRTPNLSTKRRAELKLQGQYMGHMRQLKPRQKARVKAVRAEKGIRAGIAAAKTTVNGSRPPTRRQSAD